jgi:hypothetical protein
MKRLSIALAAIGLSAGALAAIPAGTDPTEVMVPQLPGGFVIGVTGYYLQGAFTDGDLDYAVINTGTTSPFFSRFADVDPGYDWGWGINAGYIFPGTPYDVNVNYIHWSSSDTDHTIIPRAIAPAVQTVFITNPFNGIGTAINGSPITLTDARAEYTLNQVDLTAGEYVFLGCRTIMHPFMGLRWADLERKLRTHVFASNTVPVPTGTAITTFATGGFENIFERSDFDGIGPIFGVDASFYLAYGLGIVGHFDAAMLVGNTHTKTDQILINNMTINNAGVVTTRPAIFANFRGDSDRRIVPVIDAKLGGSYTFVFCNASNSDLTLEAGWQVSNYFNAIDRLTVIGAAVPLAGALPGQAMVQQFAIQKRETSSFGFQGPYINLTFHA